MRFLSDPRRRSVALLASGVLLFFALLGALQAFNIRILNPVTAGETLVFTGLTVLVFLLLMCSEMSPKALARSRRGVVTLGFMFFLMATFVTVNKDAFGTRRVRGLSFNGAVEQGPNP